MAVLEADGIHAGYGKMEILHGVSVTVDTDEIVSIIGPNGAGKSTLMKTIIGLLSPTQGKVFLEGENVTPLSPHQRVRQGMAYVPQLENIFPSLTVRENLEMSAYTVPDSEVPQRIDEVLEIFPDLRAKLAGAAGTLSGGMRQMLAMGRALMTRPSLVLLDEPSAGLAPVIVDLIFAKVQEIRERGAAILVVEQNAYQSLEISDRGYVLVMGQNRLDDTAEHLLANEEVQRLYLGG